MNPLLLEICTDSVASCQEAEKGGAARVELCANLFEGGTTPTAGCLKIARQQVSIPIHVLLRPRGGDFCYSAEEFAVMQHDLDVIKSLGADGVVLGVLQPDGNIDLERTATLIEQARPLQITFHRAFDMVADPFRALEQLIELGVERILTSGQEKSALEGSELIAQLIQKAAGRIITMPGGGITDRNIARLKRETNAQEFHLTAREKVPSSMIYRNNNAFMGGELRVPEYELAFTSAGKVAKTQQALQANVS
ncbi:copper homeostasis protein CutC [Adhaeribacter pallidiroseus]|uniref:PF03932 family protein CutC n=1 Tax=Adhaeribacter pallidiroseus TaxID=2072847 RepID=A0A369QIP5_9BACT|nr:copper homeostasis protein CutC [Adhaeribacter pallidiroseus]RDC64793.1 Copper homeostasis protein CutC [Adhaeribacter pallidiroseus]